MSEQVATEYEWGEKIQVSYSEEMAYLLEGPVNAAHLARSIEQYRSGKTSRGKLIEE